MTAVLYDEPLKPEVVGTVEVVEPGEGMRVIEGRRGACSLRNLETM